MVIGKVENGDLIIVEEGSSVVLHPDLAQNLRQMLIDSANAFAGDPQAASEAKRKVTRIIYDAQVNYY